jgi:predicted phosphodiesterase
MRLFALLLLYNILTSAINCSVSQIHISQGLTPNSMTISWVTPDKCVSLVKYGTETDSLHFKSYGDSSTYSFTYALNKPECYQSGHIHQVTVDRLEQQTRYFYEIGDSGNQWNFTTLPKVGHHSPISFGVIGDLGQTNYSAATINHLLRDKGIQMILHAGDLSYADCNQTLWDSYGELIEPLAKRVPWMVCAGNHEIEFNGTDYHNLYTAFEKRYQMPCVKEAEFGDILIPSAIKPSTQAPYCTPSIFQSEYNYGNSFYSFDSGMAHFVFLNPYSNTNYTSKQYNWLLDDLSRVDRTVTPWVIIVMHCPWYSSNTNHYGDQQTVLMRDSMEYLFYKYHVNIVFSGHVHAYERTYPVFQNQTDERGTVYITIGDGGNLEGLDSIYYNAPSWSAFRNGEYYGYGVLTIVSEKNLLWRWKVDGDWVKDEVILSNTV